MSEGTVLVNWDEIPDDSVLPTMRANCQLKSWEAPLTTTGRLMYRVGWLIEDPAKYRGMFVNDNFIVGGTDERAEQFDPHSIDARRLKAMFKALKVPLDADLAKCFRAAEQAKCCLYISAPTEKDKAAGFERNRVRNYYALGTQEVGVIDGAARTATPPPAPAAPPPPSGLPQPPPVS